MYVWCIARQEDDCLSSGISPSYKYNFRSLTETTLDRRRPIVDATNLRHIEATDLRATIGGAGCYNDCLRAGAPTIAEFDLEGRFRAVQFCHFGRYDYFRPEFNCLLKCTANENVTGDAGWKPEIILDPCSSAGLYAKPL